MAEATKQKIIVLVSGAGIAGPTLAWWLTQPNDKLAFEVTIVERSARLRPAGQNIDIRGPAIKVIERMGLRDTIQSKHTGEKGLQFVNAANHVKATFPMIEGDSSSFTSEFEITRSDLTDILYSATTAREGVHYVFDESICKITNESDGVQVEFANGKPAAKYDYVIGADGLGSKVRRLAFAEAGPEIVRSLGQISMFFTIPKGKTDNNMARVHHLPHRRVIYLRPDNRGTTRAGFSIMTDDKRLKESMKHGAGASSEEMVVRQKELTKEHFQGTGWEVDRILQGMEGSEDFYMTEAAQIHMGSCGFTKGRVALLGDAGYCPSYMTGMGTSLALQGAYYLASQMLLHGKDGETALKAYQTTFAPVVQEAQKLIPGAPKIFTPETAGGIWFLQFGLKAVSAAMKLGVGKLLSSGAKDDKLQLPEFTAPAVKV